MSLGKENGFTDMELYCQAKVDVVKPADLSQVKTCALIDELKQREGVDAKIAEPYEDLQVSVNGPAIVLVVTD